MKERPIPQYVRLEDPAWLNIIEDYSDVRVGIPGEFNYDSEEEKAKKKKEKLKEMRKLKAGLGFKDWD